VLAAITRIVNAEAVAAGAPPVARKLHRWIDILYVTNDARRTDRVVGAFRKKLSWRAESKSRNRQWRARTLAVLELNGVCLRCFGLLAGLIRFNMTRLKKANRLGDIPTNHNPHFAPVVHPTLETGVRTLGSCCQSVVCLDRTLL